MTDYSGKPMREALISAVGDLMGRDENVFFLSADMGAPSLDRIRETFTDRFINVGIAEQNMINVAAGLAMEGFTVYTYAIAPFYLRTLEQIRINLSLPSQLRDINVNMLALGAGFSYDVSGPTHHCLEDISVMRSMPNVITVSPADWQTAAILPGFAATTAKPKYFRLDGKVHPTLYATPEQVDFTQGFRQLRQGERVCIVATGVMTHQALKVAGRFGDEVGVIDLFLLDTADDDALTEALSSYATVITWEEGFAKRGGLDACIALLILEKGLACRHQGFGMPNAFDFTPGDRYRLHDANGFGEDTVVEAISAVLA
ncbi:MAG: transketolase [Rhodospirillales bacterium]|nr:transketolase [Rhodospirillales bacterium]